MLDPEALQVVIQGGAVGILLMFGVLGYRLARLAIDSGFEFVNNHLAHNTEAIGEAVLAMREVSAEIRAMSARLGGKSQ